MNQCVVPAREATTSPRSSAGQASPRSSPSRQSALERARDDVHPHCMACGSPTGVGLIFTALDDGSVETTFPGGEPYQGYSGFLHGGAIATLLDSAMTNCIFAHGRIAVTAELTVSYRRPVRADIACTIRARLERCFGPLFIMQSELVQDGHPCVIASAKFMETATPLGTTPPAPDPGGPRLRSVRRGATP